MDKLIKLSDDHYIIVNDSEILNCKCYDFNKGEVVDSIYYNKLEDFCKRITHSTKPLEQYYGNANGEVPYVYHKIREIKVSDMEKLVNGYSVEGMAYKYCDDFSFEDRSKLMGEKMTLSDFIRVSKMAYIAGFNAHRELHGDKLYGVDDMKRAMWELGDVLFNNHQDGIGEGVPESYIDGIKKTFVVRREWDIEIDENGCNIKII